MQKLTQEERKEIIINILIELDKFCKKEKIHYFLTGGTLLGAIRHKGFIPWDDDADVAMLREDYERFNSTFNAEHEGNIKWINIYNTKDYYLPFGKLIDTRTYLLEDYRFACGIGVYVDVFPIDNVGDDKKIAAREIAKRTLVEQLFPRKFEKISKEHSLKRNLAIIAASILPNNGYYIAKKKEARIRKVSYKKNGKYVANLYGAYGENEITLKTNLEETKETEFEGHMLQIPAGYENYLHGLFGDYMQLPPVEERVTHHHDVAYWI